jgi:hypothetical protein
VVQSNRWPPEKATITTVFNPASNRPWGRKPHGCIKLA